MTKPLTSEEKGAFARTVATRELSDVAMHVHGIGVATLMEHSPYWRELLAEQKAFLAAAIPLNKARLRHIPYYAERLEKEGF